MPWLGRGLSRLLVLLAAIIVICATMIIVTIVLQNSPTSDRFMSPLHLRVIRDPTLVKPFERRSSHIDNFLAARSDPVNVTQRLVCLDPDDEGVIEDTLCLPKFDLLKNYKNPCFIDWSSTRHRVRCLPYFHVLGVDKCGTTDLFSRLARHPQVLNNSGGLGKETYFWCWVKYGQWMTKLFGTPKRFEYYLKIFDHPASVIANTVDDNGNHPLITGDGTPMDFWDFRWWPLLAQNAGLDEPAVITPHLMRHVYPNPKFIVILRNPVDRLYSDYIFLGYGFTPEKFREDVPKAIAFMENCLKVKSIRQCVFSNHTYVNLKMRIHIGMYSVFMREWLAVFPRSSFYILRTEDYHEKMTHHLRAIFHFLDLVPLPEHELLTISEVDRKHETAWKKEVADMYPDTRKLLTEFYSKYTEELAELLADPQYLWMN